MPRKRNVVPAYLRHKPSGQAFVTLAVNGKKKFVYLGPYGSEKSRREYARVVAEVSTHAAKHTPAAGPAPDLTVNEVIARFRVFAESHYRHPDGTPTDEVYSYKLSLRPLRELYGHTPAKEFGPLALKAVRQDMVARGWCRTQVNARVNRVRRLFKWAASEELVPTSVHASLTTVAGLQAGRSAARERDPVKPVPVGHVEATLPLLNRHVAGLVRFQLLTGCRPGEACRVRRSDIDMTGAVWVYNPKRHKNAWRGKGRAVAVGPKAQALLKEFFTPSVDDYLFSPRRAVEEFHAARAAARKTPRYPSHVKRNAQKRVKDPKRAPAERYTVKAYDYAVRRAAKRAGVGHWHPNQLRHAHGTLVRERFGLEAAQVALGHDRADVTQLYAERNLALAVTVAAAVG